MNTLILHHYPASPYAEKVRAMLGFKGLAWNSVIIPLVMPKPDVVALTGGYRRTPILQIGADIYCDTALIARVLDRLAPGPTLFPYGDTFANRAMAHFAEGVIFNLSVPIGFQPGGMVQLFLPDATPEFLAGFAKDRAAMRQGGTLRRGPLAECKAWLANILPRIEAQFGDRPFLLGASPSECDFALYHVLWPVWKVAAVRSLLEPYPRTLAFIERVAAFGQGKPSEITSGRALEIAKKSRPEEIAKPRALETDGIALGDPVQVMPVDYALDPVKGELLDCSAESISLRRTDPRAGTVAVHFPRCGYQLQRAS